MKHIFYIVRSRNAQLSVHVLIFSVVAIILMSGFVLWTVTFLNVSVRSLNRSLAFSIAEAGIEYYRWHLAHDADDFEDGTGGPGPYVHSYFDKNGVKIGEFSLTITPPPVGSTIVTIRSIGRIEVDPSLEKIIEVRMGIPSFAKYAWALNDFVHFGTAAEVFGEIYSNNGLRFDGRAYNLVQSALSTFDDPTHSGANEWAVHTHVAPVDPLPPAPVNSRPDVFLAGRAFPVPALDFPGLTQDLAQIRLDAIAAGRYVASTTDPGYEIVLRTDDQFDLYRVTALVPRGACPTASQTGWGTWSVQTRVLVGTYPFPANGLIFVEDDLWVRGQINSARLTIAAGRIADVSAPRANIIVNSDVLYTNYDGQDVISLIGQNDLLFGLQSEDDLRIDAALVAQTGRIYRYYYAAGCAPYHTRQQLTSFGMLASYVRPGVAYGDGTGYLDRDYLYDANLLYSPPPSFPLADDEYELISWEEIQ